ALPLGRYRLPAVAAVLVLAVLALGVPLGSVLRWLHAGGAEVWNWPVIGQTLLQTLGFGVAGALVTVVLAFPVAWLAVRHPGRFTKLLEGTNYITSSLPGIVVALAFVSVTISLVRPLYQTVPVAIAAYVLLFLPRALVNLRAGLAQVPHELEETAQSLGRPPL
ncbi:ABC transporter permease subunit, partial [Arthrobacter deserti]|nr:ABC transporter permease subunit [Arthrobacter deserti]